MGVCDVVSPGLGTVEESEADTMQVRYFQCGESTTL